LELSWFGCLELGGGKLILAFWTALNRKKIVVVTG